ncbi:hypothetical protein SNE40_012393 [Patella caerulea]|uniref:thiopurine S-methyltransferase n=1 Tax=Patella caerulea TaxID=87958 RepID=A0AAN8JPU2_PATCE
MSVEDWEERWELGQTHFHKEDVHPTLQKYYKHLTRGRDKLRFYVPLCGKTVDMSWLADKGHTVIGCEGSDLACHQFFEENSIPYVTSKIPGIDGIAYVAGNKAAIGIYRCDFFQLSVEILEPFDCIWDRGSFVAIPVTMRQQYADSIIPTLKKDGSYLLDTFQLSSDIFAGPPFNCTEDDVYKYFGNLCNIEKLESTDICGDVHRQQWGLQSFDEVVYLLTLK